MYTTRYNIYGKDRDDNLICDCSFDTKVIAIDCLIHFINYFALKNNFNIWRDDDIRIILDSGDYYHVGTYSFWIEEREI